MEMTPENVSEWLRVAKDVDAAISEQTMAWYILDDKNEVESTDYHGWLTWTKTGDLPSSSGTAPSRTSRSLLRFSEKMGGFSKPREFPSRAALRRFGVL